MRIVIDLQGAQSTSRSRGIGRYSLALAYALVRNCREHEILLVLNGLFPEAIELIREKFKNVLPPQNICVFTMPGSLAFLDRTNDSRRDSAEYLREAFIASLEPDVVLVSSMFEGLDDDAASSIGRHTDILTAVVLYDLIPLIHKNIYLSNPEVERWYTEKIQHLKLADLLLAISDSSGSEAVKHLGFDPECVVSISTACEPFFSPCCITTEKRRQLQADYGIERQFVMYTGGIDHRKNIEGLIRAYARLDSDLRKMHQLVIVCKVQAAEKDRLLHLAECAGLKTGELVLTGYVSDDDMVILYNACKFFVFPSWHEGFGLPALEAMQCGKAVIAANTSSLPEVVGHPEAMFNPYDENDIASKLRQALEDENFRNALERHGLEQSRRFSWDVTAVRALEAIERLNADRNQPLKQPIMVNLISENRLRLAYISPLPPEKSGIANYSAELLRELKNWYEIDVIVEQSQVKDDWIVLNCAVRDIAWFRANHRRYDRILYHIGNSPFHRHMFDLLEEIPGVVVLHDFFLSGIHSHREWVGWFPNAFTLALHTSHGYKALLKRHAALNSADVAWEYPCNLQMLQQALGVIVHSDYSRKLVKKWYGEKADRYWQIIPCLRVPANNISREEARRALGLDPDVFLVCTFGMVGRTKLSQRILDAFILTPLSKNPLARLVFVGENEGGEYGQQILNNIDRRGLQKKTRITGWTNDEVFRYYLAAADIAVQLRTMSRGETSGAVLDCMNHGLPVVVNAHCSFAEIDPEAVWMLPDVFEDAELAEAMTTLWQDADLRLNLGRKAQVIIRTMHAPAVCAAKYAEAIENTYRNSKQRDLGLLHRWADHPPAGIDEAILAKTIALNFPPRPRRPQMLIDVSTLVQVDAGSGIQRVTRSVLREWLLNPPDVWAVEPVYSTADSSGYRYARRFVSRFLGIDESCAQDEPIDSWPGDVFVGLDLTAHLVQKRESFFLDLRTRGIPIVFVVYDLLPILRSDWWPAEMSEAITSWLQTITRVADGLICISKATLDDLVNWLDAEQPKRIRPLRLGYFHLGADVDNSCPSTGLPKDYEEVMLYLRTKPTFLMVGTIEPRKGYAQVLAAFEMLWAEGQDINLVIAGKQGWMVETLIERLRQHPEVRKRLFWLNGISDEFLELIYDASSCLIAASLAEGFGLPLIEAARHKLPIIARGIPVFREVAGDFAFYFSGDEPEDVRAAVRQWMSLDEQGKAPRSDNMPWLTWQQSAKTLEEMVICEKHPQWTYVWKPSGGMDR